MKRAVLIGINWKKEELNWSFFEGDECDIKAEALKESIENDFPDSEFCVYKNKEAIEAFLERWLGKEK